MCGRYTLVAPGEEVARRFGLPTPPHLTPRYNIAPTQAVPIVRAAASGRELATVRWGLVPFFAKDPGIGARMVNARAETAAEKPAFRAAFRRRRCLVPATGFFEWQKAGRHKQPHLLRLEGGALMAFAGLFERWEREGEVLETMTILTGAPNRLAATVHDRMPVILPDAAWATWLDPDAGRAELEALLVPHPAEGMEAFPVSRTVNSPANDVPDCLAPLR